MITAEQSDDVPTDPGQDHRRVGTPEPLWNLFDLTPEGRPDWDEQISYRFDTAEHLRAWLDFDEHAAWLERAEPHVIGPTRTSFVTGLESWFTLAGRPGGGPAAVQDGAAHLDHDLPPDHGHRRDNGPAAGRGGGGAQAGDHHRPAGRPDDLGRDAPRDPGPARLAVSRSPPLALGQVMKSDIHDMETTDGHTQAITNARGLGASQWMSPYRTPSDKPDVAEKEEGSD
jgi:hypothetical protein